MKLKTTFLSALFFVTGSLVFSQIPAGYYNTAAGLTGPALKTALHNIIDNHTVVSYSSLWGHFASTDKKSSGKVWDMYSDNPGGTPPYEYNFVSDQCGSYGGEADCFNREHSWPQSWFSSLSIPGSDLFHIYPTDGYVNNKRGNYPYGTVGVTTWTSLNGGKLGYHTGPGYSSLVFEPIDEYKGDLARSHFYMSTRYESEDSGWSTSAGTNKSNILPWYVDLLLSWNQMDPVSAKEIARNNAVYGIQDNRNPYIDHPEWVDSIWSITFTGINESTLNELSIQIFPNPGSEQFSIEHSGKTKEDITLRIYNLLGEEIYNYEKVSDQFIVDCSFWNSGIYILSFSSGTGRKVLKFAKD
ncbi:MAG: endonuclease [Bacteroidota bacterium]|nr:endonuclease [Bacteroidota bacterium]